MWHELFGMALLVAFNPMLWGAIVLVISRPRPVQNLLAFWVSCVVVNLLALLIPLMVLHEVPSFAAFTRGLTTRDPGSGIQPLQLGTGVLALSIAALITVRSGVRQRVAARTTVRSRDRQRVPAPTAGGRDSAVLVLDPDESSTDSRPPGPIRTALKSVVSPVLRLMGRARDEWDSGALWVSMALSLIYMLPPPMILLISTVIVGSGTAIVTQVIAVVVFVAAMFIVFEITLLSYAVAPAKTAAVMELVHGWALAHRTQILICLFGLVGIWQLVTGLGIA
jgi:hypothetical protein